MLKILLPLLLCCLSMSAFAQTKAGSTEKASTEVVWLNSDFYRGIESEFEEFTVGFGYRYNYVGLGLTFLRYSNTNLYNSGRSGYRVPVNLAFLNAYGFLPIGNSFALYGTYGFEIEEGKLGNAGAGIQAFLGEAAMIGVGAHTETGLQVFIGTHF